MRRMVGAAVAAVSLLGASSGDGANWQTMSFGSHSQAQVTCSAGLLCAIELNQDEEADPRIFTSDSDRSDWYPHLASPAGRPTLIVRPARPGLRVVIVLSTSKRLYHLSLASVSGDQPTYASYSYSESTPRPRQAARAAVRVAASPVTMAGEAAAACSSMVGDYYQEDAQPAEWRPARTCHDSSRTYVQLAPSAAAPVDVPVPYAVGREGERVVNYTYDSESRTYRIEGVPTGVVLALGGGKRGVRMRCTLVAREPQATIAPRTSPPSPSPLPTRLSARGPLLGSVRAPLYSPEPADRMMLR